MSKYSISLRILFHDVLLESLLELLLQDSPRQALTRVLTAPPIDTLRGRGIKIHLIHCTSDVVIRFDRLLSPAEALVPAFTCIIRELGDVIIENAQFLN